MAAFNPRCCDSDSLVVGYDAKRGEPRGHKSAGERRRLRGLPALRASLPDRDRHSPGPANGVYRMHRVIDACDSVMEKIKRPPGLIRYDSRHGFAGKPTRWLRPRTMLYTGLALLGAVALTAATSTLKSAAVGLTAGYRYSLRD